ncbi:GH12120 [Drosophila grimshawi]|uniref:GH12120 n=1 Tax=Drosophila grimshawi TaxID=7222 RepID=B4JK41_DROGR|nr:GH12120 [Drosophila grimshawi]
MNITELLRSYQNLAGDQASHINEYVARSLLHVVHTHIMSMTSSLVLILCCRNQDTCNFYNEMMIILFRSWGIAPLQIVNVMQGMRGRHIPGRRHFNLIFTDSYAAFAEIEVEAYSRDYAYNEHYYIFLQARDHLMFAEMGRIFEHCWRHQLINCNVQVQRANGDILVYTYQPFGAHSCANMTPQLINRYNGSHMLHPQLYPRKLTNFFGCPLRIALWHMPPYWFLSDSDPARITGGIEGRLLHTISHRLNFSIQVRKPPPGRLPVRERMLQMLHRDEADLTVGAIRPTVAYNQLATSSHNYYQTSIRFAVLRSHYELSSLDTLLYPYPRIIWLGISLVFALSLLLLLAMDRVLASDPGSLWLNVQLIFVGMPMEQIPRFRCKRLYCIMLMVYTLLIRTAYQGMLYHLIRTHQLNRLPQSIEELVTDNYTVITSIGMYDVLSGIPSMQHVRFHRLETETTLMQPLIYIAEHPRVKRQVVANVVDIIHLFNRMRSCNAHVNEERNCNQFEIISQDVINLQMCMYLRKHSFLLDEFNEQIMWMRSVGLLSIWTHWELDDRVSHTTKPSSVRSLDLLELQIIFAVVLFGFMLSTIIFGLELLSLHFVRLRIWFHR